MNQPDYNSFSDLFSVYLKTHEHRNLKLLMFYMFTTSLKILISKVPDFRNFELSPLKPVWILDCFHESIYPDSIEQGLC